MKCPYCGKKGCKKRKQEITCYGVTFMEEFWFCTNCEEKFEDGGMVNKNYSNYIKAKEKQDDK